MFVWRGLDEHEVGSGSGEGTEHTLGTDGRGENSE